MSPDRRVLALFAADLHLGVDDQVRGWFQTLLDRALSDGVPLYLLGDVFHYWFGPKHLSLPMYEAELEQLAAATGAGARIVIVPGNRDFLLGRAFERATGVEVLGDDLEVCLGDQRIHLSHGDLFATADVRYLRMRRVLRTRMIRFLAHTMPRALVAAVAGRLRRHSEKVVPAKSGTVLEPDRTAVTALFEDGYDTVICGHFHETRDECLGSEEGNGRFIILEPFEERGFVLAFDGQDYRSERIGADARLEEA